MKLANPSLPLFGVLRRTTTGGVSAAGRLMRFILYGGATDSSATFTDDTTTIKVNALATKTKDVDLLCIGGLTFTGQIIVTLTGTSAAVESFYDAGAYVPGDVAVNGTFTTDVSWTKGSGWTIGSGVATAVLANTALSQVILVAGFAYTISYTVTRSAGSVLVTCGTVAGTARSTSATFTETITGDDTTLSFTGTGFSGTLDNVTVLKL